ncbi:MAG: cation transporter [Moraxellaceae bacterium]|jgi:cation diffusion facilitator family transporter|nr:cation transporter [Moraxellaceae bacterium]MBP7229776.1 cation transporter [Moraxellaceae bacterium]MBP9045836.1 cation transporter [Moraxellaceae bacterium]MBP9730499.1 cation transporter [Moraxellaceae bacterium]HQV40520.1 cation diffusion facilitator family transporter [Moraxellaceae bacterium]
MTSNRPAMTRVQRAMLVSMAAAIATIVLKFGAYFLTGSVGLYSDAMESLVNLAAAILGFVLLGIAAAPADDEHPFGHEKAEFFASGAEGMLILFAAIAIAWSAINRLITPMPVGQMGLGILLSLAATIVNAGAAWWLMKVAHAEKSIAVESDAHHLLTDVWTSVGILVALALLLVFPQAWWLDPVVALVVSLHIVRTGVMLMRRSVDVLMDVQLPPDEFRCVDDALQSHLPPEASIEGLRTRHAGHRRFVEFNLILPGEWTVVQSHDICDALEDAIRVEFPATDIVIHVEPNPS